jgi:hypothetical protein
VDTKQEALFYERVEDAIDAVIYACGGRKKFCCEMWPDKPMRDAHNLLDACLNPERREKFSPAQMLYILKRGHEVGCHSAMRYVAAEAGYDVVPLSPEANRDRLAEAISESSRTLKRALDLAERMPAPKLRGV